jgi:uroporphyrinogen-III decarboxylase
MDVRELAPKYQTRLGYCGNIDARVLETNDLDRIREEIRSKLAATMPYNAYIYHSDHSVPPGVTLETYQAVLAEVRESGRYA